MSKQQNEKVRVRFNKPYGAYNPGESGKFEPHIAKALCGPGGVADLIEDEKPKAKAQAKPAQDKAVKSPSKSAPAKADAKDDERKPPAKTVAK